MKTLDLIEIAIQLGIKKSIILDKMLTNDFLDRKKVLKELHLATQVSGPIENKKAVNTNDLYRAITPYEKIDPSFEFIGVFPIDIAFSYQKLLNINFDSLKGKDKKMAIVWNTAPSEDPGKHWICLFINFKHNSICYFDSIKANIDTRINNTLNIIKLKYPSVSIFKNKNKIQYKKGNCGIYVIFFIVSQILGKENCKKTFSNIEQSCAEKKGFNKIMNNYRKFIFKQS